MSNFLLSSADTNSDNSYILRKMLVRGVSEAYYRYRLYEGVRALKFQRIAFKIEDVTDVLSSMTDRNGRVKLDHRITITQAIQDCYDLLALDHAETVADYRNLMADLTRDVCPECQGAMVGA